MEGMEREGGREGGVGFFYLMSARRISRLSSGALAERVALTLGRAGLSGRRGHSCSAAAHYYRHY